MSYRTFARKPVVQGIPNKPDHQRKVYQDITQLIANPDNPTPMVKLSRINPRPSFEIYCKLEWFNPFGSVKDRAAKYLIDGLLERGLLNGQRLVEPTSGNTGIALTAIANVKGYQTTITIPEAIPEEKQTLLRLLGAEVWPTPDDLCPVNHPKDGAIALAKSFTQSKAYQGKYVMPNQYENPDNVQAHYETTGPEIWQQTEGRVTHFFAGLGTCGTISGVGRFLKENDRAVRVIAIEPQKNHRLPGLKNFQESREPPIFDRSVVDEIVRVEDREAYETAIRLAREESLLVGPSTGAVVSAALSFAEKETGLAVVLVPDSAFKYVSFYEPYLENQEKT